MTQRLNAESQDTGGPVVTIVDIALGVVLLAVGVAGLVLPFLPGWLLIFAGLVLIAGRVPPLRAALNRLLQAAPLDNAVDAVADRPQGRASLIKILRRPRVRQVLNRPLRWRIVNRLARAAADDDEMSGAIGGSE